MVRWVFSRPITAAEAIPLPLVMAKAADEKRGLRYVLRWQQLLFRKLPVHRPTSKPSSDNYSSALASPGTPCGPASAPAVEAGRPGIYKL
jgi:hypothetical protein